MMNTLLTLLLTLQLTVPLPMTSPAEAAFIYPSQSIHANKVWWGLIDPELSTWFARLPADEAAAPLLWDWSWRSFFAALFPQPLVQEADHASAV